MFLPHYILEVKKMVCSKDIPYYCKLPYPGHPKGCPNYGKRQDCPPNTPFVLDLLDESKKMYLVYSEFNLDNHVEKMRFKFPTWSERQLRNVLYWQPTSKKQLRERCTIACEIFGCRYVLTKGEAYGVNFYATAFHSGLKLERIKELKINRHIAIVQ